MLSQSECQDKRVGNFCQAFGELAISYNGHLVDCVPKEHSCSIGTILTIDGKIYTREECGDPWELILSPAVFFFYDNKTNFTYQVDSCKKSIQDIEPHGRILDCTDKKIYEIKDNQWCPVCDLNAEEQCCPESLVFVQSVSSCATGINFSVQGTCPEVISEFSQIQASNVNFITGTVALPASGSPVLYYSTNICGKNTNVAQIFIREPDTPRMSGIKCLNSLLPGFVSSDITPLVSRCSRPDNVTSPTGGNTFSPTGISTIISSPTGQLSASTWTVPVTGDWELNVGVSYDGVPNLPNPSIDPKGNNNFILVRSRGTTNEVLDVVLVQYDHYTTYVLNNGVLIRTDNYEIVNNGRAVFNELLNFQAGDVVSIYLVTDSAATFAAWYYNRTAVTINAHLVACTPTAAILPTTLY